MKKNKNKKEVVKKEKTMTVQEYFDAVKGVKNQLTKDALEKMKIVTTNLQKKAIAMGQQAQLKKLDFILRTLITKEIKLIDRNLTTYVYIEDVLKYIDMIKDKPVYIVELERFPREIPDAVAQQIIDLKKDKVFDKYFIVYSDYTDDKKLSEETKKHRNPDPILFGAFIEETKNKETYIGSRLYYLADWEDAYCDLTLSKMVKKMAETGANIEHTLSIPMTDAELSAKMNELLAPDDTRNAVTSDMYDKVDSSITVKADDYFVNNAYAKPTVFTRVKVLLDSVKKRWESKK